MDGTDHKILSILQNDSRVSYAELARRLNLSETAVRNRVGTLTRKGVIRKFTALLNAEKVGMAVAAIICVNIGGEVGPVAASKLVNFEEVTRIYTVTGEFDLILHILCRDIKHLERVVEKIRALEFTDATRTFVVLNKIKEVSEIPL